MPLHRAKIQGIVQGVGFRPCVALLAEEYDITGTVANKGSYVEIIAEGTAEKVDAFFCSILERPPKRANILHMKIEEIPNTNHYTAFSIVESEHSEGAVFVSPDLGICDACKQELFDPRNRRYLHPFINCTDCGPRLTILETMPYDRERTSMKDFPMCERCHAEYTNKYNRRYDAQPVCCNACGPEVYLLNTPSVRGGDAIIAARKAIIAGEIIAVKGIGGFHLVCDATNSTAIAALRDRKHRPQKPFAVMAKDLTTARRECDCSKELEALLDSTEKPILLLPRKKGGKISPLAAPENPNIGLLLPYAPIHLLLLSYPDGLSMPDVLIMTSGNPSSAPICRTNEDALKTLSSFASLILTHNRAIRLRADDTVLGLLDKKPYMLRRSRGYAPLPVHPHTGNVHSLLAMGGELKNSFCLTSGEFSYLSPYIGDLGDLRTENAAKEAVHRLETLLNITPEIVVHDLHPNYQSKKIAEQLALQHGISTLPIQHHYAHILSCMAENDVLTPVLGIALDGTGYGTDGSIWGGEFLHATPTGFERLASIAPFTQAGGDIAAKEGYRIALSLLYDKHSEEAIAKLASSLSLCSQKECSAQLFLRKNNINTIASTSTGRLFDAVSAVLGFRTHATFEGEAAMQLQFHAESTTKSLLIPLPQIMKQDGRFILPTTALFHAILEKRLEGFPSNLLARTFHEELAKLLTTMCLVLKKQHTFSAVALSGGVFQNALLTMLTKTQLERAGFSVLTHHLVPPNDGGLALGQAIAGSAYLSKKGGSL